jgi:diaminopimelate decarboxylase
MKKLNSEKRNQYRNLVTAFGSPLYVYEAETIENQIKKLNKAFSEFDHRLLYAAKALGNQNILKLVKKAGCGLDAVSIHEVELGLRAGFKPEEILFTPSNVPFAEIEKAKNLGVHINIDSLSALRKFGQAFGSTYPVFVRINPHILAGGNPKIQTGHIDSKFGISIFQLNEIEAIVKAFSIDVEGLHVHTGSEFLDPGVFLQGAQILFQAVKSFPNIRFIDFGSGFKVAYKEGDVVTPIEDLGQQLAKAIKEFQENIRHKIQIWFEPGKFLVSEAGIFLCTVTTLKRTPSSVFLGVDTGLNHLIRPMMYDAYHEIENLDREGPDDHVYNVAGFICETDTLGYNRALPESMEGDVLAIRNAGAYGFSMASNYNARLRPAEVLILDGEARLIRKREELEDLLKNQLELEI